MIREDFLQSRKKDGKTSFSMLGVTFEDVMNLPISCLELSGTAKRLIVDGDIKLTSTLSKKLKTLGDLVSLGYDNLEYFLMQRQPDDYEKILYDVELALADFSLKLSGSDFSVYDISVKDLGLSAHTVKMLEKNYIGIIEQVCSANSFLISRFGTSDEGRDMLKQIKVSLRNFGVKFKTKFASTEAKPQQHPKTQGDVHKVPKIFPKILESLNSSKANDSSSSEKSVALVPIDYSNCEYDYSALIKKINSKFDTLAQFKKECEIDRRTLKLIFDGEKIYQGTLEKLCEYFGVEPKELVTYNCKLPPCTVGGVAYDYATILTKLFSKYTNQKDIKTALGMSTDTLRKMMRGQPVQRNVIFKLCSHLKIRPQEVISLVKTESVAEPELLPDVDYSKLLSTLKTRALSIQSICEKVEISPFQTVYFKISHGKHIKPEHLSAIANYLSVPQQELVTVNRTIGEVQERNRQARLKVIPEYDYSRLFDLMYLRFRTTDIEEFAKAHGISQRSAEDIKIGRKITSISLNKYARLLGCSPESLCTKIGEPETPAKPQKEQAEKPCDYTKFLLLLDKNFKSLTEASTKTGIARGIFSKINNGEILSFNSYKKLMEYFNISLDDICVFRKNEDKRRIMSMIYRARESKSSSNYMDFSKLLALLKERNLSHKRFRDESKIGNETFTRILNNRRLSNETLKKITDYLHCELSDIIDMAQYKSKIPNFEGKPYDYTKLYTLLEERHMGISTLVTGAGLPSTSYIHFFKNGIKVSDGNIEKICKFLNCTPEDIVSPNQEVIAKLKEETKQKRRRKRGKRVVAVHSDKLLSSSLTQNSESESSPEDSLPKQFSEVPETDVETPQITGEDTSSSGGGSSGNGSSSPNAKFYFGETGYINIFSDRVKRHIEKTLSPEIEIQERTL